MVAVRKHEPGSAVYLGSRYRLLDPLGAGGMGTVYRAFDRLTGETVALKRVVTPFAQPFADPALRLALTREFQALASLRHPNIIAVRDYGFDRDQQPYFTMDLLPNARTIVAAGQFLALADKLTLLVQVLHALDYLHRRQIVHGDLKPGNILIVHREVKVLDFGLATIAGQVTLSSGTLMYTAPEVLRGGPATIAADLFALGVVAYELLAGWHPFGDRPREASEAILHAEPDWTFLDLDPPLIAVLQQLLAKRPEDRFADAPAVITALSAASGQPLPTETVATRESFLQAAPLIGRESELAQLSAALDQARAGQGSLWLIRGESGVGKSRLLGELRTRALVQGVLVVRGQANGGGGGAYHLWRDVLRWLVLLADAADAEAAVLQPLVPDMADLLARPLLAAPPLDPKAAQTRLLTTVDTLLHRAAQHQPILCLLEDMHWADANSLELLQWLQRRLRAQDAGRLSVMIVASYRHDEAPQLPNQLTAVQSLDLRRLSSTDVAALGEAMLGPDGRRPYLVEFLQRETEGNAFFVVEVLRALAEEAGQLGRVAAMALPAHVFAGGIQQVVQRRLLRIPEVYQPLLQLAAVAGRQVDLAVLGALVDQHDLDVWLTLCANALVLGTLENRWQFHHDKLREGILAGLALAERRRLHQQVGAAIERVHAQQLALHVADLAYHFGQAEDVTRERHYSRLAGEQAAAQFANADAVTYLSRALELTPPTDAVEQFTLLLAREKVYQVQADRQRQRQDQAALATLAEQIGSDEAVIEATLRQANYAEITGDYPAAVAAAQRAIELARGSGNISAETQGYLRWGVSCWRPGRYADANPPLTQALQLARTAGLRALEAECLNNLGTVCRYQGEYAQARRYYHEALAFFEEVGDRRAAAIAYNNLGVVCEHEGNFANAHADYERSLRLRKEIGDRRGEGIAHNNLGVVADSQGHYDEAIQHYQQALAIDREANDRWGEGYVLNNLGFVYRSQGDYATAKAYCEQALQVRRAIGERDGECETLAFLGLVYHHLGERDLALTHCEQAVQIALEIGARPTQGYAWTCLGHALASVGKLAEAADAYRQAVAVRRALGEQNRTIESLAGLVRLALLQDDRAQAQVQVEEILAHLACHNLDGTEEPFLVHLTCYEVLHANADARAFAVLQRAYTQLQERAVRIEDPILRHSFLENVAAHRALSAAWSAVPGTGAD